MRFSLTLFLVAVLATGSACAAHVFVPPTGVGVPASEGAVAWAEATSACRDVKDVTGTLRVTVRQGRVRTPGLDVGFIVTADGRVRLEDSTAFTLAGTAADAQLLLRQDRRVVKGRADEIVDAFIGVRLGPERLFAVLTGCVTAALSSARPDAAVRFDKRLAVSASDGRVFLQKKDSRWRAWEGEGDGGLLLEYRRFDGYWPQNWLAVSSASPKDPIVLDVSVEEIEMNKAPTDPAAFSVDTTGAMPMTVGELRATGPLRGRTP